MGTQQSVCVCVEAAEVVVLVVVAVVSSRRDRCRPSLWQEESRETREEKKKRASPGL